jgi:hypothetical protein
MLATFISRLVKNVKKRKKHEETQRFMLATFISRLVKNVKKRRLWISFWNVKHVVVPGVMKSCQSIEHRLVGIQADIDRAWRREGLLLLQKHLSDEIGYSCPHIKPDMLNNQIHVLEPLNFEGGEATVVKEDLPILHEICTVIVATLGEVDAVNDALQKMGGPRVLEMPHVRIEGHVQKVKTSTAEKMQRISQERAQAVVDEAVKHGCPARLLHPQGLGASHPIGTAEENRRVEIHLMMSEELETFIQLKFGEYDIDGSGELSHKEVHLLATELGMADSEIESQLGEFNTEAGAENGISIAELQSWFRWVYFLAPPPLPRVPPPHVCSM